MRCYMSYTLLLLRSISPQGETRAFSANPCVPLRMASETSPCAPLRGRGPRSGTGVREGKNRNDTHGRAGRQAAYKLIAPRAIPLLPSEPFEPSEPSEPGAATGGPLYMYIKFHLQNNFHYATIVLLGWPGFFKCKVCKFLLTCALCL